MPGYYLCAGTLIGAIAAVHEVTSDWQFLACAFQANWKTFKIGKKIPGCRSAGFDFDGIQPLALLDKQVYFYPACLPIVKQAWAQPAVRASLVDFRDDPAFKNRPSQRMESELFRFPDAQQVAYQAAVE